MKCIAVNTAKKNIADNKDTHDLKTPLTSGISYIELVVQMVEENLLDLEAKGGSVVRNIKDITSTLSVNIEFE